MPRLTPSHRIRKIFRTRDSDFHPQSINYKWWVLANVMIGTFMAVLDATIVNVGLPKIMASFGVSLDKIEWVITAYMLAMAVMLPTCAWLADKFGYKRIYFWGLFLFTLGSFMCGFSQNEYMLIFSRVIQGFGAGAIQPIGMAIITREFPPKQRGVALGFWAIAAAASVSFGPLIGGYLVDNFSWQLIFNVNVPVGIIGLIFTIVIQREYKNKNVGKFDTLGFISVAVFLPVLLYALAEGNAATNSEGWTAPYILVCFAIAAIALAVFLTNEFLVKEPLIELRLLKNHNFGISNIIMFIFGIGMFGSTFLLPLFLQNSLGYTAYQSGLVFLPIGILQGCISPIVGKFSDRTNPKIPLILGVLLLAISFYLNGFLSMLSEHSYIMTSLYIRGLGMGMLFTPLSSIALYNIPREKMGQAAGIINVIRQIGGSFGVALLATLLTARVSYHSQIYSQSIQSRSEVYREVNTHISAHIQTYMGASKQKAARLSQAVVAMDINNQAFIQGIDDDFLIACILTLAAGVPIIFLYTKKQKVKKVQYDKS